METKLSGLPIVYDEVFTGLYRLGRASCSSFLSTHPDISVHAKLLTGGFLPRSVTLANGNIFKTFLSDKREDALRHGHSYIAHPMGCQVALDSLKIFEQLNETSWSVFKKERNRNGESGVWSIWSPTFIEQLSYSPQIKTVFGLGSVLAITLADHTL